MNIKDVIKEH